MKITQFCQIRSFSLTFLSFATVAVLQATPVTSGSISAAYSIGFGDVTPQSISIANLSASFVGIAGAGPAAYCPFLPPGQMGDCTFLITSTVSTSSFGGTVLYNGTSYDVGLASGNVLSLTMSFTALGSTVATGFPAATVEITNVPFSMTGQLQLTVGGTTLLSTAIEASGFAKGAVYANGEIGSRTWAFSEVPEPSSVAIFVIAGVTGLMLRKRLKR